MAGNSTNADLRSLADPHQRVERRNSDSPPAEVISAWLVSRLSTLLAIEPSEIDTREPFASYGLGSTELVSLSGELGEWLGRQLSPELAYECPTIEALARHLADPPDLSRPSGRPSAWSPERSSLEQSSTAIACDPATQAEPIAIIGIGCRFPGANDPVAFRQLLRDGVDAITEVPADRFDLDAFYDPDPQAPGKISTRWGGFLDQVDRFDAHFFGVSPREAARMDPQQRLLLEVAWEALEDGGQVRERLAGSQVGVFIGISNNDYGRMQLSDPYRIDAYAGTGNALSIAANRLSYLFDFRGPSIAIDTACSSSLVAVYLACRSLQSGESTLALAGGVNLILAPTLTINFSKAGVMAPDGRCKAFDARANGYVRSEGAGVVILKPLSRAVAEGDPVYAVIRGSAVNQDGRSNGLMAPNPLAQEAVLREAYRRAGVSPGRVQYVEAHGTGTFLGDPIEAKALGAVLAVDRPAGSVCALGSVKTNIGHLEAAAGIAGLIKVALGLKYHELLPSLHFREPNPHIPFEALPLRVQTAAAPWPSDLGSALAGVTSLGFGGTNAHVVLEEAQQPHLSAHSRVYYQSREAEDSQSRSRNSNFAHLLPLSARSPEALQSLARAYLDFLAPPRSDASLGDICYTASARRSHHDYRLAVTGSSCKQLIEGLAAFLRSETHPGLFSGRSVSSRPRKLVFVFPGQGSQWWGMGRELLRQEAVFSEAIERCDRAMAPYCYWSLLTELAGPDASRSRLNEIDVLQPALFAIQVALAALWRSWGIEPQAVVGHSMGEVAASCVAGALSLEDAVRVICRRSRLIRPTVGKGAMAAAELSIEEAERALAGYEDRVSIAASNGPGSTILSGDPAALKAILDRLRSRDIFCAMLKVDFASHSPQMDPLRADLLRALDILKPRPAALPIYSTVTGKISDGSELGALHWVKNLREPVLFSTAVRLLLEDGHDTFLEVSPHPVLLSAIQQGIHHRSQEGVLLPSLRREEDGRSVMLGSLGALYALGYSVDWARIHPPASRCVQLPSYPWQRERCWLDAAPADDYDSPLEPVARTEIGKHPLLGRHFKSADPAETHFWELALDKRVLPYLDEHRIQGAALLPASLYLEMALAGAREAFAERTFVLRDIEFHKALFLPETGTRTAQMILSSGADGTASIRIYSRPTSIGQPGGGLWTLHASAKVCLQPEGGVSPVLGQEVLAEIRARCSEKISGQDYYSKLSESGVQYGAFFQSISQLWRYNGDMLGEVRMPDGPSTRFDPYQCHPAILDACLQTLGAGVASRSMEAGEQAIYVPTHIDQLRVYAPAGPQLWSHAHLQKREHDPIKGEVRLLDGAGRVALEILGLRFDQLGRHAHQAVGENPDDWLYELEWWPREHRAEVHPQGESVAQSSLPGGIGPWLIFADSGGVGDALAARLQGHGDASVLVTRGPSYERADAAHFRINPEQPEDLRRCLAAALPSGQTICRGIIHLWSLDAGLPGDADLASLNRAQKLGCCSVLQLVQELVRIQGSGRSRLWLITRGAQAAGQKVSPVNVAQAPLWGLGRVIAQEHPTLWGGLIDLEGAPGSAPDLALPDPALNDAAANQLCAEISTPDGEDQIAFRQGRRHVARLIPKRRSADQTAPLGLRPDGSYLITGGLGDLGLLVARWMVERGARRLILLGRTQLPARSSWSSLGAGTHAARQIESIRELEAMGASVHLAAVDVADKGALRFFLDGFRSEGWPPIRGVVHAAGILHDGLLTQLDSATLESVLRPKVMGGWLLHRLLEDAPLDFFVLFSSAGSLLGQPGQGNYAAANAFLDALAHHRRAQGQPALTLNWGAWADSGFADTAGGKRLAARLALLGITSMAPQQALAVMEQQLRQNSTQVIAIPVDWRKYREFFSAETVSPLLSEFAHERGGIQPPSQRREEKKFLARDAFLTAQSAERQKLLQSYLSEQVARVLGLSVSRLDLHQPLSNLGLDSLMAVELKNRIALDLGVNVPMVKFLQGPSVEEAVAYLFEQLTQEVSDSAAPLVAGVAPFQEEHENGRLDEQLLANLDRLSDEEVDSLLADTLAEEEGSE